ncbi:MAG: glycosyltransferase family 4 protein [Planctomycetes bacterium]|nr:glycosyltransferase family 4 protein [Planctomycetota bacterium]
MEQGQIDFERANTVELAVRPVLIASKYTIAGYSQMLEHLLAAFTDDAVSTAIVCPAGSENKLVIPPLVEVVSNPAFDLPLLWRQNRKILIERLEKFKPTVLHCLCQSKAMLTRKLARQFGVPYILSVNSLHKKWLRFSVSSKRCAKIIVPAQSVAAELKNVYPGFDGRIEQINVGTFVDQQSGCFGESSRLASIVVGWPLKAVADFEVLFGAIRHLAIDGYEFLLVLTGAGAAETKIRNLLEELGLAQMTVVVPGLQKLRGTLAAGDIFVQPQMADYFNSLLLEAISFGSVVAACKGGVDDLLIENKTAVIFEPDDELSVYAALQKLLDDKYAARQFAKTAQQYVRENYSVGNMASATLEAYRDSQNWFKGNLKLKT